jgi:hypothetical protein
LRGVFVALMRHAKVLVLCTTNKSTRLEPMAAELR